MPTLSIIIPNYNHAAFLRQRIESVLHQTYTDYEIILLDDGSTDNSKSVIEQYRSNPKFTHIIYNPTNSGSPFSQWQKGLLLSSGKYIWIAESDDVSAPEFLEKMIDLIEQNSSTSIAYCRTMQIDESGNEIGIHAWPDALDETRWTNDYFNKGVDELRDYFIYRNIIVNVCSAVFKKEDALSAIEYVVKKNMRYCGDWLFFAGMLMHGDIAYLSTPINYQRYHQHTTRSNKTNEEELQRIIECIGCVNEVAGFLKMKIDLSDKKFDWIFGYAKDNMPLSFKMSKDFIRKVGNKKRVQKILADHIIKWHFNPFKRRLKMFGQSIYKPKNA